MSDQFRSKKFKALFKTWNKVLANDGFKDVEDFSHLDGTLLKEWDSLKFRWVEDEIFRAKQDYFMRASHLLHTYEFKAPWHKEVWRMYSEGKTVREIAKLLKRPSRKKSQVWTVISSIRKNI